MKVGAYLQVSPYLYAQINIDNLFDQDDYVANYTHYWIQPSEPRKAILTFNWKF